jgi:hypothetical protein
VRDKTPIPERRFRLSVLDHIASTIITYVSWYLLISGALFCGEALFSGWTEFLIGAAIIVVGYILRVIRRRSFKWMGFAALVGDPSPCALMASSRGVAAEIFHQAQTFSSTLTGPILTKVGRARSGQQSRPPVRTAARLMQGMAWETQNGAQLSRR